MSLRKTETAVFRVALDIPVGVNAKDCENYIRKAVQNWVLVSHTNIPVDTIIPAQSPLLNLDADTVRVSILERHTHYVDTGNHGGGKRKRPTPTSTS